MIEAHWLFKVPMDRVQVGVHLRSVAHSMVEFVDGSILAELSTPDMCLPIKYTLTYTPVLHPTLEDLLAADA